MSPTREITFQVGPFPMAGQIDYPEGEGPFPAVLIVPGPPQHNRYGNVRGYKAYSNYLQELAEAIVDAGYAVFRWDKGGTGKSSSGLSAPMNMVSAFGALCSAEAIDHQKVAILAIGGGSAHVYRKWLELEEINKIYHLVLLSTGVNDLKLESLDLPICLVAGAGRILRSERALSKYSAQKGHQTMCFEAETANEQLFDESEGPVNLFTDEDARWHAGALAAIQDWFTRFN